MIEIIGYVAAVLTTGAFLPQAIKVIKTRNTKGISLYMYIFFVLGVSLWAVYGFLINDLAIILANCVTLFFALIILNFIIVNIVKEKTELY